MRNIFSEFEGADLERLCICLDAVRRAGLATTKHTRAGKNKRTGNVWVWDEDWAGCVAVYGRETSWFWSCPECGDEHEFATYAKLEAFAEANSDGRCSSCRD